MKLSSHLQHPQEDLVDEAPLVAQHKIEDSEDVDHINDGREAIEIKEKLEAEDKQRTEDETETPSSGASSRSSSVGRN
ncbi:hypothetical protein QVD17_11260 [Tagetes erecta]|uniref:Uncharacterized protein n=1 Tax=Tagetes erecta TaxID=13708 RepID=A0AAD8P1Z4_TARER|nr:hypothetical protein QVD17_11260 [Tagetes erecta]